jgi:hypothetical protein
MRADCRVFSTDESTASGRLAVIADHPADVARLASLLGAAAGASKRVVYRGDLSGFAARQSELCVDLALLHIAGDLEPAQCARIDMLTRRLKLIVTGDESALDISARIRAARAWSFIRQSDLAPGTLADSISALGRARGSEDRLLRKLGDRDAQIRRLVSAASLIPPVLGRVEESIWRLAGLALACAGEAGDQAARAFDAVDELKLANQEFGECVKLTDVRC